MEAYVFILPLILGVAMFFAYPLITSIRLSLSEVTKIAGWEMEWIGIAHFREAIVIDVRFMPLFVNSIKFTLINTPLIVIFALIFAIILNKDMKLKGFFRVVFFLPFLLGTGYIMESLLGQGVNERSMQVARGIMFPEDIVFYLGPRVFGVISDFLNRITIVLWRLGVQVLLYLSGLQGISPHLYESAKVDGATEWEMFWKVTLPMISPVIILNLVYTMIDSFVDIGNPVLEYFYDRAFTELQFDYAAALTWIYSVFILVVLGIVFAVSKYFVYDVGRK
jgi:ABC-type sugar transport system permease subunit